MGEFRMPSLGADMDVGTIVEWRVAPGDEVRRGDIVAVVDTEKSTIEVEIFEDGVIEQLLIEPGVEVPVGTVLALVAPLGGATPEPVEEPAAPVAAAPEAAGSFVRAAPRARREAAQRGLDLTSIQGRGPGGAVLTADLDGPDESVDPGRPVGPDRSAGRDRSTSPVTAADRREAMRHAIATLMARSKREIPHYYLATTIDLRAALAWLADANAPRSVADRLLPAALLLKAAALAAREVPAMNGFWTDHFEPSPAVHLGVAVSLRGGGLVAPAIHDADQLSLDDLMRSLLDLVQRTRVGTLRSSEMSDPTLTVTNLGDQGVEEVFGVIYPPQVALVGFGRVVDRPWAEGGLLGVRPVVRATLAADHRASDGHDGARYLATIDRLLQHPEDL